MKKVIIILLLVAVVAGLSYFGYNTIKKQHKKKQVETVIQQLPPLSFYTLEQEVFLYKNTEENFTLIIYFHPECEHCQYEAKQLVMNREQFSRTQILMISPAPLPQIKQFNTDYQLASMPSLKVLWDKERKFETYFGVATFPTVFIYSNKNKLLKKYNGEVKIEAILKYLKHNEQNGQNQQKEEMNNVFLSLGSKQLIDKQVRLHLFDFVL